MTVAEAATITVAVEIIGPQTAQEILSGNVHNRHVRGTRVKAYARAMIQHEWALNGETIKISESGKVLDGQHRLLAVVESGVPLETVVIRGLRDEAQETIDIGDKRSLSDALMLRGEKNANVLAAALVTSFRMENDVMKRTDLWPTNRNLLDYLESNGEIRDSLHLAGRASHNPLRFPPSQAVALHYLMEKVSDTETASDFWNSLFDGINLVEGDAVIVLRNFLIRDLAQFRRSSVNIRIAITVKAWNARREGRSVTQLRWSGSGPSGEKFPVIR